MLIGTAGHIDHGKTRLIEALTGVRADRLPEEKQRGITIELGYAYSPESADGSTPALAFIDVPGHEKFVPTMLAGASGIDHALLVVAADDGVMPQTREHLAILALLGIPQATVVVSKIDRVDAARLEAVQAELDQVLAGTAFDGAPRYCVSAQEGKGMAALRAHLHTLARSRQAVDDSGGPRLVIDRRFALAGAGTVVTGTLLAGRLAVGEQIALVRPGAEEILLRIRGLHVNNRAAEHATPGSRCAVNLAGIDYQAITRGDCLCAPGLSRATQRVDLQLQLLPASGRPISSSSPRLGQWSSVSLHHAGGQAMARLVLLDEALEAGGLAAGDSGLVQAVLDRPLLICSGDRVVLRDAGARQTLGGGIVLDPFAPSRHRRRPERLALLSSQLASDRRDRLAALVEHARLGIAAHELAVSHNLLAPRWEDWLPDSIRVAGRDGEWLFAQPHWTALGERILARLAQHHDSFADEVGVERERLRRMCAPQLPGSIFLARLDALHAEGQLARSGSAWHLPSHVVTLSPAERSLADRFVSALAAAPFDPPWVRDLAAAHALEEAAVRQLLRRLAARGEVFQVVRDLFYARCSIRRLGEIIVELSAAADGRVRAAALRDHIGGGRKRAIQILEFFDRVGYTRRVGEGRERAHLIRGEAPAQDEASDG